MFSEDNDAEFTRLAIIAASSNSLTFAIDFRKPTAELGYPMATLQIFSLSPSIVITAQSLEALVVANTDSRLV